MDAQVLTQAALERCSVGGRLRNAKVTYVLESSSNVEHIPLLFASLDGVTRDVATMIQDPTNGRIPLARPVLVRPDLSVMDPVL